MKENSYILKIKQVSLNTIDTVDQETFLLIITKNFNYFSAHETLKSDIIL